MTGDEREEIQRAWDEDAERFASLGQVAGELMHDLANVMAVVHGSAALALGDVRAGSPGTAELERLVEATEDMGAMLRDVLEMLRGSRLSPEVRFDPVKLVQRTVSLFVDSAPSVEINLHGTLPASAQVPGRASFLSRALLNLLNNAARHARSQIRLTLSLREEESRVLALLVEDDGPGISRALLPEFPRTLVPGETRDIGGMGLSAVAWAMQQLNGGVTYRGSSALGGAAFELWLPAVIERPRAPSTRSESLAGRRLVLIEDDPAVQRLLVRLLARMGAEASVFDLRGTPLDGIRLALVEAAPDAILLDLRLGSRDGTEIWAVLRDEAPDLAQRVVFLSGLPPGDPQWEAAAASGRPMLAKPLDIGELAATLASLPRRGG